MVYVYVECQNPGCKEKYALPVKDDALHAECPTCHQFNTIDPRQSVKITGRCELCGEPIDQPWHEFTEDDRVRCERKKK